MQCKFQIKTTNLCDNPQMNTLIQCYEFLVLYQIPCCHHQLYVFCSCLTFVIPFSPYFLQKYLHSFCIFSFLFAFTTCLLKQLSNVVFDIFMMLRKPSLTCLTTISNCEGIEHLKQVQNIVRPNITPNALFFKRIFKHIKQSKIEDLSTYIS